MTMEGLKKAVLTSSVRCATMREADYILRDPRLPPWRQAMERQCERAVVFLAAFVRNAVIIFVLMLLSFSIFYPLSFFTFVAAAEVDGTPAPPQPTIEGDAAVYDSLFLSREMEPLHLSWGLPDGKRGPRPRVEWTEGPLPLWDGRLLFSDTVLGKIFVWSPRGDVDVFLHDSGDAPKDDGVDRAEPGANGLAIFDNQRIIACQHGHRRVALVDLITLEREALVGTAPAAAVAASIGASGGRI